MERTGRRVLRKLESGWEVLCVSIVPQRTKQHLGAYGEGTFLGLQRGPRQLTAGPMNFNTPVFSGDSKKLFVLGEQRRGELVRYDTKAHQFLPYLSGISADRLGFSRDGQWVAYVSYPDGTLWRSKIDGTHKQQLTFQSFAVHLPRWSPDGNYIVFDGSKDGKSEEDLSISAAGGSPGGAPGRPATGRSKLVTRRQLYRLHRFRSQRILAQYEHIRARCKNP